MWRIWLDVEEELKTRMPFNPVAELMSSPVGAQLAEPLQQVSLPANLPPAVIQQLLPSILSQIQSRLSRSRPWTSS
jgi:hypothetical protein